MKKPCFSVICLSKWSCCGSWELFGLSNTIARKLSFGVNYGHIVGAQRANIAIVVSAKQLIQGNHGLFSETLPSTRAWMNWLPSKTRVSIWVYIVKKFFLSFVLELILISSCYTNYHYSRSGFVTLCSNWFQYHPFTRTITTAEGISSLCARIDFNIILLHELSLQQNWFRHFVLELISISSFYTNYHY